MVTLSEDEMLRYWLRGLGIVRAADGASVQGEPEAELTAAVKARMQSWYAELLLTGPNELLPCRDLAAKVTEVDVPVSNCLQIGLPQEGARLLAVQLMGWEMPVRRFARYGSAAHRRQGDVWLRASQTRPVVVLEGRQALCYGIYAFTAQPMERQLTVPPTLRGRIQMLLMTAWPEDGSYTFDASLAPDFSKIIF